MLSSNSPDRPRTTTEFLVAKFVENLNPSEDGEALRNSSHGESSRPNCLPSWLDALQPEGPHWFAVYTTCRHEKRVVEHLGQRGISHFLPLYSSPRKWRDGSKGTVERPLFPCYVFARFSRFERARVLSIPGALAIVGGTGRAPAPVPDDTIDGLRLGLQQGKILPHLALATGQQVLIRSGPFAGMRGIVTRRNNGCRVVLTLQQIMQSISMEADADDLEPIEDIGSSIGSFMLAAARA